MIPNHGGDVLSYEKYYEGQLLDFSSNINPLGYPKELSKAIKANIDEILVYPDIQYRKLKSQLSNYLNVDSKNIVVGNGAMEVLDSVIAQFKRIIIVDPSFSEYELRAKVYDLEIIYVELNSDMTTPIDEIKSLSQEGDLILLTNPHNPSGLTLTKEEIIELYMDTVEKDGYLLLDEAFFEFANLDYETINIFKPLGFHNIGIVRASTKFFGVPGLRLGYGVFDIDTKETLEKYLLPWSVNAFAANCCDVLFNREYIEKSKEYINRERERYINELQSITGVHPYPSNSNYVLLRLDGIDENYVFYELLKKGLLIRRCSNFRNLSGTHIRVAIKKTEENNRLIKGLKEIMEERDGILI